MQFGTTLKMDTDYSNKYFDFYSIENVNISSPFLIGIGGVNFPSCFAQKFSVVGLWIDTLEELCGTEHKINQCAVDSQLILTGSQHTLVETLK